MKPSFSYHLTLLVIKLKGLKKTFSQNPIDYKKIRKEDMPNPKGSWLKKYTIERFNILKTSITQISKSNNSNKLLIFIHGGAFISGPAKHHWDAIKKILKQTDYTVWMCNYPKAPEHKIIEISKNIDAVYKEALSKFNSDKICLIGDSVGGTLVTTLTQRLIKDTVNLPQKIILISPVMDATLSNPDISKIDLIDPMLSKSGVLSAKKMCAENDDLKNEIISPLYGNFKNFPNTTLFMAENDITYPDQKLAVQKFKNDNVDIKVIVGTNMPHIWPLLPVMKEAKTALKYIIQILND